MQAATEENGKRKEIIATEQLKSFKLRMAELVLRIAELKDSLTAKEKRLTMYKKKCEGLKRHMMELNFEVKRQQALLELEELNTRKLANAMEEYKKSFTDTIETYSETNDSSRSNTPDDGAKVLLDAEYDIAQKERLVEEQKTVLAKRKQEYCIRKNYNAARIIRFKKMFQTLEENRKKVQLHIDDLRARYYC